MGRGSKQDNLCKGIRVYLFHFATMMNMNQTVLSNACKQRKTNTLKTNGG